MAFKDILDTTLEQIADIDNLEPHDKVAALIKLNIINIGLMDHLENEITSLRKLIIDLYNHKKI